MIDKLKSNMKESLYTILPIFIITLILKIFVPIPNDLLLIFLISCILMILGTGLFTFGADISMAIIGEKLGNKLIKSKSVFIILLVSFIIGTVVTIGDGIALIHGLTGAMAGELLLFPHDVYGMVLNLEEERDM